MEDVCANISVIDLYLKKKGKGAARVSVKFLIDSLINDIEYGNCR